MSEPGDNVPKLNGQIDPMQRLASFKPPRDYSLGVPKPNKKVFVPNLNVKRNKKGAAVNTSRDKKEEKYKKDKKNDRNKNFKNGPNIIKSDGVFSEGVARSVKHSHRSFYGNNSDSGPTPLQRPVIKVNNHVKFDKELEEQKIRKVTSQGQTGLDAEEEDFRHTFDKEAPIRLPFDEDWAKIKSTVQVKQEPMLKIEPPDADAYIPLEDDKFFVKKEVFEDTDLMNLLKTKEPTMMLVKFPDPLPGCGPSSDDDGPRRKPDNNAAPPPNEVDPPVVEKCTLKQLEEGQIGKLCVHRSGRVTLRLGDSSFEVSLGTKSSFHQEVVSVSVDEETRSALMVSLGPLAHKLTVTPNWEEMFQKMDASLDT